LQAGELAIKARHNLTKRQIPAMFENIRAEYSYVRHFIQDQALFDLKKLVVFLLDRKMCSKFAIG